MPWRTSFVLYKQMQSNPIISLWSQSFKAVDFSQLVCSDVSFIQTQRNFYIQISLHKNYNVTWVRIASFWKEAVLSEDCLSKDETCGCPILTHWGWVMHIWVSNLTIIGSDNGLSPGRRQAISWTNAGILLSGPLGTNISEILITIPIFSFEKMGLKVSSAKWRPFCLGLNVLKWVAGSDFTTW